MKKIFVISAIFCMLLTSCVDRNSIATAAPTYTPKPGSTSTSIPTKAQPTKSSKTPTITPFPTYQTKQAIFNYYRIGGHSVYDIFLGSGSSRRQSMLVLYSDGQMIISGKTYKQKLLTPDEMKQFLSKLEALGFYSIESNQKHDSTDKLYNFGNNYQESFDAPNICIAINTDKSQNLCVYEPDRQYVIPEMAKILQFLDEYNPTGMTSYFPNRILLWVQAGKDPNNNELPTSAIPWDNHLPPLDKIADQINQIGYIDGDIAKEIYQVFDDVNSGKVFIQNEKEYTAFLTILLPHEEITNSFQ